MSAESGDPKDMSKMSCLHIETQDLKDAVSHSPMTDTPCTVRRIATSPLDISPVLDKASMNAPITISSIPPELIKIILKQLLSQGLKHDLLNALQVSPLWANIGRSLFWKNVVLDGKRKMIEFITAAKLSPEAALYTQSLTVGPRYSPYAAVLRNAHGSAAIDVYDALIEILPTLRNLQYFSFSHSTPFISRMHISHQNRILQSLPNSLRGLELSIHPWSSQFRGSSCSLLPNLPHLQDLRIDVRFACPHLFSKLESPGCPELSSIVINDSHRKSYDGCESDDGKAQIKYRSDLVAERIALAGREAYEKGLLPALKEFIVVARVERDQNFLAQQQHQEPSMPGGGDPEDHTLQNADAGPALEIEGTLPFSLDRQQREQRQNNPHLPQTYAYQHYLAFSSLQCKDVIENQTTFYPIARLDQGKRYWMIRYPRPIGDTEDDENEDDYNSYGYENEAFDDLPYNEDRSNADDEEEIATCEGFGDFLSLTRLVEGISTWVSTTQGSRFPPSFVERKIRPRSITRADSIARISHSQSSTTKTGGDASDASVGSSRSSVATTRNHSNDKFRNKEKYGHDPNYEDEDEHTFITSGPDVGLGLLAPEVLVPAIKQVTRSRLWNWERRCGRWLLRPGVHDGLGRGEDVMREKCREEIDVERQRRDGAADEVGDETREEAANADGSQSIGENTAMGLSGTYRTDWRTRVTGGRVTCDW